MNYKGKIPPKQWDKNELSVFSGGTLYEIEIRSLAVGLSKEEVLEYYGLELGDLPPYDRWFFDVTYARGRLIAKQNATAAMFEAMKGRDQLNASLAYMTRFGNEQWKEKAGVAGGAKEIRIVVDE
jgi:hypothetical protein